MVKAPFVFMSIGKIRIVALLLALLGVAAGFVDAGGFGKRFGYRLGLDLAGGTHLVYRADESAIAAGEVDEAMAKQKTCARTERLRQ